MEKVWIDMLWIAVTYPENGYDEIYMRDMNWPSELLADILTSLPAETMANFDVDCAPRRKTCMRRSRWCAAAIPSPAS